MLQELEREIVDLTDVSTKGNIKLTSEKQGRFDSLIKDYFKIQNSLKSISLETIRKWFNEMEKPYDHKASLSVLRLIKNSEVLELKRSVLVELRGRELVRHQSRLFDITLRRD